MWWNKHIHAAPHFTTWHAWFGLASISWMAGQGIMGIGMAWFGPQLMGNERDAKKLYKYHRYVFSSTRPSGTDS